MRLLGKESGLPWQPARTRMGKTINAFLFVVFYILTMFYLSACNSEESCKVPCYFGVCSNNLCTCLAGYEGDSCSVRSAVRYFGTWQAVDSCLSGVWGYQPVISAGDKVDQLRIANFAGMGSSFEVQANVMTTSFTLLPQLVQGITISGSGFVWQEDSIAQLLWVTFKAEDEWGNRDSCSGRWIRKQ